MFFIVPEVALSEYNFHSKLIMTSFGSNLRKANAIKSKPIITSNKSSDAVLIEGENNMVSSSIK